MMVMGKMASELFPLCIWLLLGFKMLFPFPFSLLSQHTQISGSNPTALNDLSFH